MRSQDYVNKRERSVTELRDRLSEALEIHLAALEAEELSPKDRIELVGRILPFVINKIAADKDNSSPKLQSDPLARLAAI